MRVLIKMNGELKVYQITQVYTKSNPLSNQHNSLFVHTMTNEVIYIDIFEHRANDLIIEVAETGCLDLRDYECKFI